MHLSFSFSALLLVDEIDLEIGKSLSCTCVTDKKWMRWRLFALVAEFLVILVGELGILILYSSPFNKYLSGAYNVTRYAIFLNPPL